MKGVDYIYSEEEQYGKKQFVTALLLASLVSGSALAATVDEDMTYNGKVSVKGVLDVDNVAGFHRDVTVDGGATFKVEEGAEAVFNGDVAMNGNVKFDEKADFRGVNTRSISFYSGPNIGAAGGNKWYGEINDKNMILEVNTFLHKDLQVDGETYSKGSIRTDKDFVGKKMFIGEYVNGEWQNGFYATAAGNVKANGDIRTDGDFVGKSIFVGEFVDGE